MTECGLRPTATILAVGLLVAATARAEPPAQHSRPAHQFAATTRSSLCPEDDVVIALAEFPYDAVSFARDKLFHNNPSRFWWRLPTEPSQDQLDHLIKLTGLDAAELVVSGHHLDHAARDNCECEQIKPTARLIGLSKQPPRLGDATVNVTLKPGASAAPIYEKRAIGGEPDKCYVGALKVSLDLKLKYENDKGYSVNLMAFHAWDVPVLRPCDCIAKSAVDIARFDSYSPAIYWTNSSDHFPLQRYEELAMLRDCKIRKGTENDTVGTAEIIVVGPDAGVILVFPASIADANVAAMTRENKRLVTAAWTLNRASSTGDMEMRLQPMSRTTLFAGGGLFSRRDKLRGRLKDVRGDVFVLTISGAHQVLPEWPASVAIVPWAEFSKSSPDALRANSRWKKLLPTAGRASPDCILEGLTDYLPLVASPGSKRAEIRDFLTELVLIRDGTCMVGEMTALPTMSVLYRTAPVSSP